MSRTCPYCGSSEIDEDPSRGDATCMGCGTVLEESRIVSDVQFQETSSGAHQVIGQFLSKDRAHREGEPESRAYTYKKGKELIDQIASQLRINEHCVDVAYNYFRLCVVSNFTRGRVRSHVVAACLYMTCRQNSTPHLLLDFSDVTQVNVFDLGRTLNFLTRSLKINLPTTDPCLYILRFAIMLDFGDKQKDIVSLATRIVQRMKNDWMAIGRRPTGICGAALLLAARAYNVNRAVSDVVRVVHISETVVRKRLDEFANTASGNLTIEEFNVVDLEDAEDPPAFQAAKQRRYRERLEEEARAEQITKEFSGVHKEVEDALKERMKKSQYAALLTGGGLGDNNVPEFEQASEHVQSELVETVYQLAEDRPEAQPPLTSEQLHQQRAAQYGPTLESLGIAPRPKEEPKAAKQELLPHFFSQPSTSAASAAFEAPPHQAEEDDESGELNLDDIDDNEINNYILSDVEAAMKANLWMQRNGAFMEELEKRRQARQEAEEKERDQPKKKKPRKAYNKRQPINASNTEEAMFQVIQEKKLSKKINYDLLKELGDSFAPVPTVLPDKPPEITVKPSAVQPLSQEQQPTARLPSPIKNVVMSSAPAASSVKIASRMPPSPLKQSQPTQAKPVSPVKSPPPLSTATTKPPALAATVKPQPTKPAVAAPAPKPTASRYKHRAMPALARAAAMKKS